MAESSRGVLPASVRARTTLAATLVVAVALVVGALALIVLQRDSLLDGLETSAENHAAALVTQIEASGLPATLSTEEAGDHADLDDPDDVVTQVSGADGRVLLTSQPLSVALPREGESSVRVAGADHDYLVVVEKATHDGRDYLVSVALSREDVDDSSAALLPPLLFGLPVLLLVVAGTTWLVVGRALRPVERIRNEVEAISATRLDRRVTLPDSRDEVQRLGLTMNAMLDRLQRSSDRQRQFVSDASHELRSPIASLRQTAEVARMHPGALPEGELAETTFEESLRMQRIVEQLLLLARGDEDASGPVRQQVDLDDLVLAQARRHDGGVRLDLSGVSSGRVLGDAGALDAVVRNLLDNAARHANSTVRVSVTERARQVELVVEDDGVGIPAGERERVFDRFVRLDEARARDAGGSGLGLAIVAEIVGGHGGSVRVEDSSLGGARFVVRLPSGS